MAEAMALGIVVSLLQQAIPAAIAKLKARFQQAKATEGEFRELEVFCRSVQDCYKKYHTGGTVKTTTTIITTTTTTATTPSPFAEALDDVQKTLEKWSSQNCRFFSRTSANRVQKLQALNRKVKRAMQMENFRMNLSMYNRVKNSDGQTQIRQSLTIDTSTAIDDLHDHNTSTTTIDALTSSQGTTTTTIMDKVSTHLVRSKSIGRPSTILSNPPTFEPTFTRSRSKSVDRGRPNTIPNNPPTFAPTFTRSRSKSIQRDQHHSSEKGRTEELWVPFDSEKQARDMKKILMLLPGVESVSYDMVTKQVWVEVGEGSNVDTDRLLKEIRCARSKYKLQVPTLWLDRPK